MGISRKARSEHFYSGLPQKADIRAVVGSRRDPAMAGGIFCPDGRRQWRLPGQDLFGRTGQSPGGQGGEVVLTALVEFQRGCARNFCSSISTDHSGNNVELGGELLLARGPLAQSDCDHGCIH